MRHRSPKSGIAEKEEIEHGNLYEQKSLYVRHRPQKVLRRACAPVPERLLFFRKVKASNYQRQDDFDNALSENLTALYIIYSNAPYVGLLGTVLGIMIVFYDMGLSGNIDVKSIVIGLSLALKATALGLIVAIPSLMAYNALLRKVSLLSSQFKGAK